MNSEETRADTSELPIPPDRWEALVQRIVDDGSGVLAERRSERQVLMTLDHWSRRSFHVPLVMAAAAAAVLIWAGPLSHEASPVPTLTEAVLPSTVAAWVSTDLAVDPLAVALALAEEEG